MLDELTELAELLLDVSPTESIDNPPLWKGIMSSIFVLKRKIDGSPLTPSRVSIRCASHSRLSGSSMVTLSAAAPRT